MAFAGCVDGYRVLEAGTKGRVVPKLHELKYVLAIPRHGVVEVGVRLENLASDEDKG